MKKIIGFSMVIIASLFVFSWCTNKNSVRPWDTISLVYTATFSDGKLFDQNTNQNPLTFVVGSWQTIQWLDNWVVGMKINKTKTITILPTKWYGKMYDRHNIQKISQLIFDKLSIAPISWTTQKLGNIEGKIVGTEKDEEGNILVLFDINPRQTRDTLKYTVTVLSKQ